MVISIVFISSASNASNIIIRESSNQPAPVTKYLFTASISSGTEHICTGIIVNNRWLLTSAICMAMANHNYNLQLLDIYYGAHNRTNIQRTKNSIKKIVIHSKFEEKNLTNNLALVKVNEKIIFIPTVVQAVYLSAKDIGENNTAFAIGWEKANQSVCYFYIIKLNRFYFTKVLIVSIDFTFFLLTHREIKIVPKC